METENKKENLQTFEDRIKEIIQRENLSWEESLEVKKSFEKFGLMLAPFVIFLFIIIRIFSAFKIQNSNEAVIGLILGIFLFWIWYKAFCLLVVRRNIISPWVIGWIEKAREIGSAKEAKLKNNLGLGIFFLFFGIMVFIANPEDSVGKGIAFGFGILFSLLGFLGIANSIVWKKPQAALYFLERNRTVNILFFLVASLFCFALLASFLASFL